MKKIKIFIVNMLKMFRDETNQKLLASNAIDMSRISYSLMNKKEGGKFWKMGLWTNKHFKPGDLLRMRGDPGQGNVFYKINNIEWCINPPDMYFFDIEWVPRSLVKEERDGA